MSIIFNGAKRIRTADPLNAIEVLYQLSYNPALAYTTIPYYFSRVKSSLHDLSSVSVATEPRLRPCG